MHRRIISALKALIALKSQKGFTATVPSVVDGRLFAKKCFDESMAGLPSQRPRGRLREIFDTIATGPGVLKWSHYFEIYERHFAKFVDTECAIQEIGVYSGGSLGMWRRYFGAQCSVIGVDIEPACQVYVNEYTQILIGDQGDPDFWKNVAAKIPKVDIILDDGGHTPAQQRCTIENAFQMLRPGGVYVCEDVHGHNNLFAVYCAGMLDELNAYKSNGNMVSLTSNFQKTIRSVSFYPFVVVFEKNDHAVEELCVDRRGASWQPFLDK